MNPVDEDEDETLADEWHDPRGPLPKSPAREVGDAAACVEQIKRWYVEQLDKRFSEAAANLGLGPEWLALFASQS